MSDAYEPFLIPVEVIGGKDAESTLKNIDSKLKEISENLIDVGYGADAMKILTASMRDLSSVSKTVASGISSLNKANAQAAKDAESIALAHQKVATEAGKTARELEKAKTQAANTAVANQKLSTEMEKTATAHARAEMAALRVAQAHEKQALKAQQAARPYNQLNQQLREQAQKLQDAITAGNLNEVTLQRMADKYTRLNTKIQETNQKFAELTKQKQDNKSVLDILKASLGTFIGMLARDFLTNAIQGFKEFAASISRAGIELDALQNTMLAATGGWESGGREIKWVIDMSNRLGLAFGDVSDSYAKFMTSFTRSGGTISQSRQIFEDLSTAMVSLHLPAERMQGVFVALEQMANKGTVQAEELKRQLGNALPGAFELAAESMGILPARLMDLMKKGEVFSKDFLPAFAATVKAALGQSIDIASMQFNASINRLATATDLLKMNLGQMVNEALLPLVNGLAGVTNALAKTAQFFNENTVASNLLKGALVGLLATVVAFNWGAIVSGVVAFGTTIMTVVIPAIGALMSELLVLNAELAGIPLIIGAVVTGVAALGFNLADTAKKAGDMTPYIGLSQQIVNLTKEVSTLDSTTEEGKQKLEEFKQSFPSLTQYLTETGKKFEELSDAELQHIAVLGEHDAKMRVVEERTKELASWQSTFAAVCQVAWDNICKWAKILWATVVDVFTNIMNFVKGVFNFIKNVTVKFIEFTGKVGKVMTDVGDKMGVFGINMKLTGQALSASSDFVLHFGENMDKVKTVIQNAGTATVEWAKNTSFAIDVADKKLSNANQNAIKKLEVVNKNSKMTYDALKQAQSAVTGLQNATSDGSKEGKGKKGSTTKKEKTEWDVLKDEIKATEDAIRVKKLHGESTAELEKHYAELLSKQNEVDVQMKVLKGSTIKATSAWQDLQNQLKKVSEEYKNMLLQPSKYTNAQIEQQKQLLGQLKSQSEYYKNIESRESVMKITNRNAKQLSDTLVDGIFEPLREGETLWSRFKDAGLDALKSIAQQATKRFLQDIVTGFTAGFKNNAGNIFQRLTSGFIGSVTSVAGKTLPTNIWGQNGNPQASGGFWSTLGNTLFGGSGKQGTPVIKQTSGGSSGVLGNIWSSVKNLFSGSSNTGQAVGSSNPIGAITNIGAIGQSVLGGLNTSANTLTQTLQNATSPAISGVLGNITNLGTSALGTGTNIIGMANSALGAGSSILGMANPAISAAQSIASMAVAAPIAATGMGALAATMAMASGSFQASAPALMQMAGAMSTLATSAAAAATSMAAVAVANAANSAAQIPFVGWLLAPLAAVMTGAGIAAGTALTGAAIGASTAMAGAGQMLGGAMAGIGNQLSGVSGLSKGSSTTTSAKVIPHAKGGIVSSPTMFPMQGGNFGLAGEAGTEVIAPARRMSNGDVGIGAVQPQVIVNNYTNAAVEVKKRPDNTMEIKIAELNAMLSSSRTNKGMSNAQNRLQKNGRQIG